MIFPQDLDAWEAVETCFAKVLVDGEGL